MSQFASVPSHFVWTLNFDNIYKLLYYILRRYNWIVKINFKHFYIVFNKYILGIVIRYMYVLMK